MKKPTTAVCGAPLRQGAEGSRKRGSQPITCMLEPGHQGNHVAWTKTAKFTWQGYRTA